MTLVDADWLVLVVWLYDGDLLGVGLATATLKFASV
jgi:hypothetical protein